MPVDTGWGERKVTTWYRVSAFGKLAERLGSAREKGYLSKGTNVFVRGVFQLREYEHNGGKGFSPEVTADDVQIIFPAKEGSQRSAQSNNAYPVYDDEEPPF